MSNLNASLQIILITSHTVYTAGHVLDKKRFWPENKFLNLLFKTKWGMVKLCVVSTLLKTKVKFCFYNKWGMIWAKVTALLYPGWASKSMQRLRHCSVLYFVWENVFKSCFLTNEVWLQQVRIMDVSLRESGFRFHENRLPCCLCVCVMSRFGNTERRYSPSMSRWHCQAEKHKHDYPACSGFYRIIATLMPHFLAFSDG